MPRYQYPEADVAVRAWVRTLGLVGSRAFFDLPAKVSEWPVVTVLDVGSAPMGGDSPVLAGLIQLAVWGTPPAAGSVGGRDRYAVGNVARQLADLVASLVPGTAMGVDAVSGGAEVTRSPSWSPDPSDGQARYLLDGRFLLRKAEAA